MVDLEEERERECAPTMKRMVEVEVVILAVVVELVELVPVAVEDVFTQEHLFQNL